MIDYTRLYMALYRSIYTPYIIRGTADRRPHIVRCTTDCGGCSSGPQEPLVMDAPGPVAEDADADMATHEMDSCHLAPYIGPYNIIWLY